MHKVKRINRFAVQQVNNNSHPSFETASEIMARLDQQPTTSYCRRFVVASASSTLKSSSYILSRRRSPVVWIGLVSLVAIVLVLVVAPVEMVKESDFKKCAQSPFCQRQRAFGELQDLVKGASGDSSEPLPAGLPGFTLLSPSLVVDEHRGLVTAHLTQRSNPGAIFSFEFSVLAHSSTAHVKIKEKHGSKYEGTVDYVFAGGEEGAGDNHLGSSPLKTIKTTMQEIRVSFGEEDQNVLVINPSPFRFEFSVGGVPAIAFNEHGYLNVETASGITAGRESDARLPEFTSTILNAELNKTDANVDPNRFMRLRKAIYENPRDGFNGHTDTEPNGPSSIGLDISFPGSSNVFGIPEHASKFSLPATRGQNARYSEPYRLYNFDVFEYALDSPMALYGSIPFMLSQKKGLATGVLWVNAAEMWIDVEKKSGSGTLAKLQEYLPFGTAKTSATSTTTHWMVESGILDIFVFLGPTAADVFDAHTHLTGRPQLPPVFSIAYHQCRWNYNDVQDVLEVDANFDKHEIPYDVLWLDIEHTDRKMYFSWDSIKFREPQNMINALASKGRQMVTIIDPHIKKDDSYSLYRGAKDAGIFVKNREGHDFEGECWPGRSSWIDYTDATARAYWASKYDLKEYRGSTLNLYTWNDMNEPSVFDGPEITMPKDNLHAGGVEHRDVHNLYGMLQQRATFEGHLLRSNGKARPFILSRAFFAGSQRYGAIWTGDNFAKWDHLEASVPMLMSIGVSGMTFAGADVGGFFGNPEPELLVRWYQAAAFQPFFRAHAHIDTKRREPWLFGEPYTTLIRDAIQSRYRLLPYLYTLFQEAHARGMPIMRPMFVEYPDDESVYSLEDQFMLGSAILVKPVVLADTEELGVYLPSCCNWYDYETLNKINVPSASSQVNVKTPLKKIPVFLRGGHIIPRRDRLRRSSTAMAYDPYTIVVVLDNKGTASGRLYVDDGNSFDYETGSFFSTKFIYGGGKLIAVPDESNATAGKKINKYNVRVERVIIAGSKVPVKRVSFGSNASSLSFVNTQQEDGLWLTTIKVDQSTGTDFLIGNAWDMNVEY